MARLVSVAITCLLVANISWGQLADNRTILGAGNEFDIRERQQVALLGRIDEVVGLRPELAAGAREPHRFDPPAIRGRFDRLRPIGRLGGFLRSLEQVLRHGSSYR